MPHRIREILFAFLPVDLAGNLKCAHFGGLRQL